MKITIDANQLQETVYGIQNLIREGLMQFTEEGLRLKAADPAQVALIDLEIPADSFEEYTPELEEHPDYTTNGDEEGIFVGVNFENVNAIAKMFDDEITFELEDGKFILRDDDNKFDVPVLNLSTDDIPNVDGLDHKSHAEITIDQLAEAVKKLAVASESGDFVLNEDGVLTVSADGGQISVESDFQLEDFEGETVESKYALDYLKNAEKMFSKLDTCDKMTLHMGDEFPMRLEHEDRRENLAFILAPRIEEQ